jgi:flagellar protein FlgJ
MTVPLSVLGATATDAFNKLDGLAAKAKPTGDKAWAAAQDFEAVFLRSMMEQMFAGLEGEGPFGGGESVGVWRSFLTDEYSKTFAKAGGIGIAQHVYQSLLAAQEGSAAARSPVQVAK